MPILGLNRFEVLTLQKELQLLLSGFAVSASALRPLDCIRPSFLFSLALQFYDGPVMAYAKHHFSIASHCLFRYGDWRAIRRCLTQAAHSPTKNALHLGWVLRFRSVTFSSTHSSNIFVSFFLKFKSIDWHLVFTWFFGPWIRIGMISLTEERSAWAAYRQKKGEFHGVVFDLRCINCDILAQFDC